MSEIFVWPVSEKDKIRTKLWPDGITQRFSSKHPAIDIDTNAGPMAYPTKEGKIIRVAFDRDGYGNYPIIEHVDGYTSLYAHLREVLVRVGQNVDPTIPLGPTGKTGRTSGEHLHFEIRKNGVRVDPLLYLTVTHEDYMSRLEDLEKRQDAIEKRLAYNDIRQVQGGRVIVSPNFPPQDPAVIALSFIPRYAGHDQISPAEAERLTRDHGWRGL